jgi:hypothetical protein
LVIGFCLGELSAGAVSLATSLHELVPVAVETIRVTFRLGVITHKTALELEGPDACNESWSAVISRESEIADEVRLEQSQEDLVSQCQTRLNHELALTC